MIRYMIWLLGCLLCLTALIGPRDQNIAQTAIPERPAILDEQLPVLKGLPMSADSAARYAMLKSLDIRIAELDYEAKKTDLMAEKGRKYDPVIEAEALYEHVTEEQPIIVQGDRTITGQANLNVSQKLSTGTEVDLFYNNQRNSTNSSFSALSRNYESHTGVTIRQPLSYNSFGLVDRSEVAIVKLDISQFNEETLDRIEKTVFDARSAYWDYSREIAFYKAQERAYEIAKELLQITMDQLETGQSEEPDYLGAEANLRLRIQDLLEAQFSAKVEMNRLKLVLSHWGDMVPTEYPEIESMEVQMDDLIASAMAHRRDYHKKIYEIESKGVEVRMNINKRWPRLDAIGTFGNNALDRDLDSAQGEAFGFNHRSYALGFEFKMPIGSRESRARAQKSRLEKEKLLLELLKLEQQIQYEVQDTYHELQITHEIALQMAKVEELERKKLNEEMEQFKFGRSDSKRIIDFQQDLVDAQKRRVAALVHYQQTKDKILLVQNKLLDSLGLTVKDAE